MRSHEKLGMTTHLICCKCPQGYVASALRSQHDSVRLLAGSWANKTRKRLRPEKATGTECDFVRTFFLVCVCAFESRKIRKEFFLGWPQWSNWRVVYCYFLLTPRLKGALDWARKLQFLIVQWLNGFELQKDAKGRGGKEQSNQERGRTAC